MNLVTAVPDTDPSLQNTKYIEPAKFQLHFRPSGHYAAPTPCVHISVPFKVIQLIEMPSKILAFYTNYTEIYP
jgi:hypothetical protein